MKYEMWFHLTNIKEDFQDKNHCIKSHKMLTHHTFLQPEISQIKQVMLH